MHTIMSADQAKGKLSNFRDKPWRQSQLETVTAVMNSSKKVKIIDAPTGSGKSLIGIVCGIMAGEASYTCTTKQLQAQLAGDFPEGKILYGRSNYPCLLDDNKTCEQCVTTKANPCEFLSRCLYKVAKQNVLDSPLRIINNSYLLSEIKFAGRFSGSPLCIIDEADALEGSLLSAIELSFTERALYRLGLDAGPSRKTVTAQDGLSSWRDFGTEALHRSKEVWVKLESEIESWDSIEDDQQFSKLRERDFYKHLWERCQTFLNSVDRDWIMEFTERSGSRQAVTKFKPLWLTPALSEEALWKHADNFILMSGTLLPKILLSKTLGLDSDDMEYFQVPSNFPVENRPIYFRDVANMTAKTTDTELPLLVADIKKVLEIHKNEKGIIHATSYVLSKKIADALNSPRIVAHTSQNREEVVTKWLSSDKPLVIISPAMVRGVSCEDDKARWCYIAKAPFLSLGDRSTSKRLYSGAIGQKWYACSMLLDVVQATGRIVRSRKDYGKSYIGDKQVFKALTENISTVPKWWVQAID
jgi:ATP-dependent DNA helicase DinG